LVKDVEEAKSRQKQKALKNGRPLQVAAAELDSN
jgi:hypothetical protein